MKLKMIKFSVLFLVVIVCCTACNGTVTRNIRHAGFSIANTFACDGFFPTSKEDTSYTKIRYFTGGHMIDETGRIYEVSTGQPYENNQNCKEANTSVVVSAILDSTIVRGADNKFYYLNSQNNVASYTEVPETDNSYDMYNLLLSPNDVVKVITANSSTGLFYILKNDGNVYGYVVGKADRNSPPAVTSIMTVYNKNDFGSSIVDFNYAGDSLSTFVKTEQKTFRMKITNEKECKKYADVQCNFEMQEDTLFDDYKDKIIMYNGYNLLTSYGQMFNVAS